MKILKGLNDTETQLKLFVDLFKDVSAEMWKDAMQLIFKVNSELAVVLTKRKTELLSSVILRKLAANDSQLLVELLMKLTGINRDSKRLDII